MPRFIDISGTPPIEAAADARAAIGSTTVGDAVFVASDEQAARHAINADFFVNALDFGATGDGTTDDTAALQQWLTYVVTEQRQGWLPNGTYKITSTLVAAGGTYGWGIRGENENYAVIKQFTDNTPILQIGSGAGSTHTLTVSHMMLTYNTPQSSSNTNAINILFTAPSTYSTTYWSSFTNLQLWSGYYAVKTDTNTRSPWGCKWDMITCYDQSGGYWDDSVSTTAGIPNNWWGRMTIGCARAVGPVIKGLRGYNFSIGTIEFLNASLGPQLMTVAAGATIDIGSLKLEVGDYTGAGKSLFQFSSVGYTRIGSLSVSLTTATPSSGTLIAIALTGPASKNHAIEIGNITLRATTLTGKCVAVSGAGAHWNIGSVDLYNGWALSDVASSLTANMVVVDSWANGRLSLNKGDADYAITLGDPNVVQFSTAFTAQRTITLPDKTSGNLFAGMYYDLIFNGAINGANTALIKERTNLVRTQAVDKKCVRYQYRRGDTGGEWILVGVFDLSDPTTTYTPTNVSTDRAFDANATTVEELADVLGTLIADLKAKGIIAP